MRYFLIIIMLLFFTQPAFAAKLVTGTVPVVQPLQPPAFGVAANVQGNIQNTAQNQIATSSAFSAAASQDGQTTANSVAAAQAKAAVQTKSSSPWLWWLFIILGLGALGYWLKNKASV